MQFFYVKIIEIICGLFDFAKKKPLVYRGFLEYVMNARGSWFSIKDAHLG